MTSFRQQLNLLLWKNYTLRKRHKTRVFMELLWPLILFLILMWVRTRGLKINRPNCHVVEKALPSVGGLEFFQNFFCTLNNTCYDDYVENQGNKVWDDSMLTKFVREVSPLMQEILDNPNGIQTTRRLWTDLMSYIKIIGGFRSKAETHRIGKVKLKDLMKKDGMDGFIASAPGYTGLTKEQIIEFLESELNLDVVNKESIDQVLDDFTTGKCDPEKEYNLIKIPSQALFKELCDLDRQKIFLIGFLFNNYVDKDGLLKKIRQSVEVDGSVNEELQNMIINYDAVTLSSIFKLVGVLQGFGDLVTKFSNSSETGFGAAMIYEGLCGVPMIGNSSTFGLDTDSANRFDSLRDRLRDWNPDHHYEIDSEISTTCNTIFQRLESMAFTSILWRQVKPFIRGVIHYAPVTPFTQEVMEGVDQKFAKFQDFEIGLNSAVSILQRTRKWLRNHSDDIILTKEVLSDKENLDRVINVVGIKPSELELERLHEVLDELSSADVERAVNRIEFISDLLSEIMSCVRYNKSQGFPTEWEAVNAGIKLLPAEKLWAVVIFADLPENDTIPHHVKYKIRMDSDKVDGTRNARDRLTSKTPRRRPTFDLKYITNGFAYLQEMVEHSIIEKITGKNVDGVISYLQQFPYPCYIYDQFIRAISRTFPLFMVLSWVYASSMIVKSIVLEKELKLKEVMKVMGLGNGVIWIGWFLDSFLIMSFSATILSIILKYGKVIEHSDFTLIWVFMMSFTVATIAFSFLISTFFTRANSAAAAGGILFFVTYLPYNFLLIWEERLTWYHMLSGSLISNVAFGFGCTYFARYEEDGVGAQWDRITWQTLPGDDFSLSYCISMLWFDSLLYWLLTWYIEAVFPDSGMPKPWNFMFKKAYWIQQQAPSSPKKVVYQTIPVSSPFSLGEEDTAAIEAEPMDFKRGVVVSDLCKTYSNGREALTDLNITFYESQITSFLGHNGAGKTTTISILTGLFPSSKGTAKIYGRDIRTDMDAIRTNLGICPQFNVLFDRLNVEEHMRFYAGLKGKSEDSLKDEIPKMLLDLGIPHKRYDFPRNLSGGMKRKLSVAIAFVGGSKTVFLDEPTSGVDPYSRRSIWELLLKYKEGRTIILTTHFMDEADLLGDRIAIISRGKLKACGTSLFLKSHYGQGYSLRLVREEPSLVNLTDLPEEPEWRKISSLGSNISKTEAMINFVRSRIPDVKLVDDVGSEVVLLLPYGSIGEFPVLFQDLDANLPKLSVSSYGISDTTLEDVFLKITFEDLEGNADSFHALSSSCKRRLEILRKLSNRLRRKNKGAIINAAPTIAIIENGITLPSIIPEVEVVNGNLVACNGQAPTEVEECLLEDGILDDELPARVPNPTKSSSCYLFFIQTWMINLKRFRNSRRNKKAMFFEIILPAVFIAVTLAFTLILPPATDEPIREITPWTYPSPNNIFFSEPVSIRKEKRLPEFRNLVTELLGPLGMGTHCLKDQEHYNLCDANKWSNESVMTFNQNRKSFVGGQLDKCSCDQGSIQCPLEEKLIPPKIKIPSNDFISDVSKLNIPEWIRKTYRKYEASRYGGFELQMRQPVPINLTEFFSLADAFTRLVPLPLEDGRTSPWGISDRSNSYPTYKIWYENRGWVSSVAYLNSLHNMLLRQNLPEELADRKNEFGITLYTHPLNLTKSQRTKESIKTAGLGVIHAVCVIFALSFVPASFTVYLIEERKCGGKHLHLVSGVKPITYWTANFLFDMAKYSVPAILCLILFWLFDAKAYIAKESVLSFTALLFLYGWASIPLMYPASYMFGIPSTAFVVLACSNLFIGVVTTVSTFVLEQFGDPELEKVGAVLKQVFLVFPHYCLGRGLIELVRLDIETTAFNRFSIDLPAKDRFLWEHLGKMLVFLFIQGICFFILTLCCEYKQLCFLIFKRRRRVHVEDENAHEDIDVRRETERVLNHPHKDSTLCAENLTKFYQGKRYPSVNKLCFAIEKGECFGLLGVNGAGKTSTFKMLTGDVRISNGRAKICAHDVETNLDAAREHFGYCPQEDGLDPLLNAFEQLQLFGRLRGMSAVETQRAVYKLIKALGLTRYADKRCGTYSGGNKRKMSTAIALIGDPDIVFLDEPTSGMDPGARRQLWKVILRLIRMGKSVVLTSHSMEECEALCTRLAIMVNGKFVCLGSLTHLKNRFGNGYTLTVRCIPGNQPEFLKIIGDSLPSAKLEDSHCSQMKFKIPQQEAKLSDIFNVMYSAKESAVIEDYSVSQTTLDDIFVKFASEQKDDMDR